MTAHTELSPTNQSNDWFRPTWGRFLFAALLAAIGFVLPQEVPLEWYPLNEPGTDINYLEISCAADQDSQVQIFYNLTRGYNELNSIRFPISPTEQTYTYTFPLPDGPITEIRLDPVSEEGSLRVRQMRIINRRNEEIIRFTRDMFRPGAQIASIQPMPEGWKFTAAAKATDPQTDLGLRAPIVPVGQNHRNLLRCLLSTGYLAGMLLILLLAVLFTFYRPKSWRDLALHLAFMASIATMFSLVGNRGLIRNSIHYARFVPPAIPAGLTLEFDVVSNGPTTAQLFWRHEQSFTEAQSSLRVLEPHTGLQTLRFPLPDHPVRGLRFDPRNNAGRLEIRGIRVVDAGNFTRAVLPLDCLQAGAGVTRLEPGAETLVLETAPGHGDPTTEFSAEAVAIINARLQTRRD